MGDRRKDVVDNVWRYIEELLQRRRILILSMTNSVSVKQSVLRRFTLADLDPKSLASVADEVCDSCLTVTVPL